MPIGRPAVESLPTMQRCVRPSIVSCSGATGVHLGLAVSFGSSDAGRLSSTERLGSIELALFIQLAQQDSLCL